MVIEQNPVSGSIMVTGKDDIQKFRVLTMRQGLKLELKGMKMSRGRSCYSLVKEQFGFKGNKQKVYDQLCDWIEENYGMEVNR